MPTTWHCLLVVLVLVACAGTTQASDTTDHRRKHGASNTVTTTTTATTTTAAELVATSNGGWKGDRGGDGSSFCNIPVINSVSEADSFFDTLWNKSPVIFRNPPKATDLARFEKAALVGEFGDIPVPVCAADGTGPFRGCRLEQLGDWISSLERNEPSENATADDVQYLFNTRGMLVRAFPELWGDRQPPQLLADIFHPKRCSVTQFHVGQSGAGLPLHHHRAVFGHEILWGAKRWIVSRDVPAGGFNPKATSRRWLRDPYERVTGYPDPALDCPLVQHQQQRQAAASGDVRDACSDRTLPDGFWDCTTQQGDILYVPGGFYHSTINAGEVVSLVYYCQHGDPDAIDLPPPDARRRDDVQILMPRQSSAAAVQRLLEEALDTPNPITGAADSRDEPDFHFHLARTLSSMAQPRHRDALTHVEAAVALNPQEPSYRALQGGLLSVLGRHSEAATAYRKALELDPKDVAVCVSLARSLLVDASSTAGEQEGDSMELAVDAAAAAAEARQHKQSVVWWQNPNTAQRQSKAVATWLQGRRQATQCIKLATGLLRGAQGQGQAWSAEAAAAALRALEESAELLAQTHDSDRKSAHAALAAAYEDQVAVARRSLGLGLGQS